MFIVNEFRGHHRAFPHALHWVETSLAPGERNLLHEIFWRDAYQGKVARICDATLVIHKKQGGERRVLEHRLVVQA